VVVSIIFAPDCVGGKIFRIKSEQYGYVSRYGNLSGQDVLEFSTTDEPAQFRFTRGKVLQHVTTGKYVNRISLTNPQLILANKRNRRVPRWVYNSTNQHLKDIADPQRRCFSPWANGGQVPEYLAGETVCGGGNKLILEEVELPNSSGKN
jgi:ribosomal protein L39E